MRAFSAGKEYPFFHRRFRRVGKGKSLDLVPCSFADIRLHGLRILPYMIYSYSFYSYTVEVLQLGFDGGKGGHSITHSFICTSVLVRTYVRLFRTNKLAKRRRKVERVGKVKAGKKKQKNRRQNEEKGRRRRQRNENLRKREAAATQTIKRE